jgi:hypothetical protein
MAVPERGPAIETAFVPHHTYASGPWPQAWSRSRRVTCHRSGLKVLPEEVLAGPGRAAGEGES